MRKKDPSGRLIKKRDMKNHSYTYPFSMHSVTFSSELKHLFLQGRERLIGLRKLTGTQYSDNS